MRNSKKPNVRISPDLIRRILIYSLLFVLLATAECSFFARLHILPATPDLMLCAVVAILLLDSFEAAMICAVGAGVLIDAIGSTGLALSSLFYPITVLLLAALAAKMLPRFLSFLALMLPAAVCRGIYTAGCQLLRVHCLPKLSFLTHVLLPEALTTFLFSLLVFFAVKGCTLLFGDRRQGRA